MALRRIAGRDGLWRDERQSRAAVVHNAASGAEAPPRTLILRKRAVDGRRRQLVLRYLPGRVVILEEPASRADVTFDAHHELPDSRHVVHLDAHLAAGHVQVLGEQEHRLGYGIPYISIAAVYESLARATTVRNDCR